MPSTNALWAKSLGPQNFEELTKNSSLHDFFKTNLVADFESERVSPSDWL